jgi:hypothetical protein
MIRVIDCCRYALASLALVGASAAAGDAYLSIGVLHQSLAGEVAGQGGIYTGRVELDDDGETGLAFGVGWHEEGARLRLLLRLSELTIEGATGDMRLGMYELGADYLFGTADQALRPYLGATAGYGQLAVHDGFVPLGGDGEDRGGMGGVAAGLIWNIDRAFFAEVRAERVFVDRAATVSGVVLPGQAVVAVDSADAVSAGLALRF